MVQSHDDWSAENAVTNPTVLGGTHLYLAIVCGWTLESSLSLPRMHGSGKLVKSDDGKNDNLSKISGNVFSYSLNSCKF